jgi:N-acetylmuramoyl-L-alanine amidase
VPAADTPTPARPVRRRRVKRQNRFGWLKYIALLLMAGIAGYVVLNYQTPQQVTNVSSSNATAAPTAFDLAFSETETPTPLPTSVSIFPIIQLPSFPTPAPTLPPTPVVPEVAIIAGHWSRESTDAAPTIRDSGAVCPDGLREVDITKNVADETLAILNGRGYHVTLVEEFDARLKRVNPDFGPKVLLSIHADSCLTGSDYAFATGYKIAHAEPSDNQQEDDRLVTCLTRSYDRIAQKYDKPFNANTITRDMTEYHAFREIDPSTPAAIIELGFLGQDHDFLKYHQSEMARGLAVGLDDFLKGRACLPPTAIPTPTGTTTP